VCSKITEYLRATQGTALFLKRRSTSTNLGLLESFKDSNICIQSKCQILLCTEYIDFRKVFDIVSHTKLLARLYSYGIRGTVLYIITYTFIIEWQHKHAGFKTKHNAQSISQ